MMPPAAVAAALVLILQACEAHVPTRALKSEPLKKWEVMEDAAEAVVVAMPSRLAPFTAACAHAVAAAATSPLSASRGLARISMNSSSPSHGSCRRRRLHHHKSISHSIFWRTPCQRTHRWPRLRPCVRCRPLAAAAERRCLLG